MTDKFDIEYWRKRRKEKGEQPPSRLIPVDPKLTAAILYVIRQIAEPREHE